MSFARAVDRLRRIYGGFNLRATDPIEWLASWLDAFSGIDGVHGTSIVMSRASKPILGLGGRSMTGRDLLRVHWTHDPPERNERVAFVRFLRERLPGVDVASSYVPRCDAHEDCKEDLGLARACYRDGRTRDRAWAASLVRGESRDS